MVADSSSGPFLGLASGAGKLGTPKTLELLPLPQTATMAPNAQSITHPPNRPAAQLTSTDCISGSRSELNMHATNPLGGVFQGRTPLDCVHRQGGTERYEATWLTTDGR